MNLKERRKRREKEEVERAISISELIDHLIKIREKHGDLKFGHTNEFGEFRGLSEFDITVHWDSSDGWDNRKALWVEVPNASEF